MKVQFLCQKDWKGVWVIGWYRVSPQRVVMKAREEHHPIYQLGRHSEKPMTFVRLKEAA